MGKFKKVWRRWRDKKAKTGKTEIQRVRFVCINPNADARKSKKLRRWFQSSKGKERFEYKGVKAFVAH